MDENLIVLTTYACNPQMGSEPGHGWGFLLTAARLAELFDLKCICFTPSRYVKSIEDELDLLNLSKYVKLVQVPVPRYFDRPENGLLLRIGYVIWCSRTYKMISKLNENHVRIIHHANYASEILPNPIPRRKFKNSLKIIGPLGSTQNIRVSLILIRDLKDLLIFIMDLIKSVVSKPLFRCFVSSQTKVIFNSQSILKKLRKVESPNSKNRLNVVCPSLILDNSKDSQILHSMESRTYKLAIVGVFNRRKKIDFALEVLKEINLEKFHCDIYGVGPEKYKLQKLATKIDINSKISWKGTIDRAELRDSLTQYDAILHPSVREGASTITGEAIVAGIPIVVFEGTGSAGTLEFIGQHRSIVPTRLAKNKRQLRSNFVAVLLNVIGESVDIGNPFSPLVMQNQVSKWYELVK